MHMHITCICTCSSTGAVGFESRYCEGEHDATSTSRLGLVVSPTLHVPSAQFIGRGLVRSAHFLRARASAAS